MEIINEAKYDVLNVFYESNWILRESKITKLGKRASLELLKLIEEGVAVRAENDWGEMVLVEIQEYSRRGILEALIDFEDKQ